MLSLISCFWNIDSFKDHVPMPRHSMLNLGHFHFQIITEKRSTHSVQQNKALVPCGCAPATHGIRPSFCEPCFFCLEKHKPNWNRFQNKLPSDEGRELYHFLLSCFDIEISKNTLASQRNISFWSIEYLYFSWIMIGSIKLMTLTMDGCLILNKLGRRRVRLCLRVMATLQC